MKKIFFLVYAAIFTLSLALTSPFLCLADQIINDDLIVDGSACFGSGCVDGMDFGFSTIILSHDDPSLSSKGSDNFGGWSIVNSAPSGDGGVNSFALISAVSRFYLFTFKAGAPGYSVYVHESGRLGIGTDNPASMLHVEGNAFFYEGMQVASSRELKESVVDIGAGEDVLSLFCLI